MSNYSTNWLIYRSHCIICWPFKSFFFWDIIFLSKYQLFLLNTCVGYAYYNHCSCHFIWKVISFRYFTSADWKYNLASIHIFWITKFFMGFHNNFKFQVFSWFFLNLFVESNIIIIPVFNILFHNWIAWEKHKNSCRANWFRNNFNKFSKFRDHFFIVSIIPIKSKLYIFKSMNWLNHYLIFLNNMLEFFLNLKLYTEFLLN